MKNCNGLDVATNGVSLGFEGTLWKMADKLRSNLDAAEYKHVVLGLIFLKYVNDSFDNLHQKLLTSKDDELAENRDEYTKKRVFWVPKSARWSNISSESDLLEVGKKLNDAISLIEQENKILSGVLPKVFDRKGLDKQRLFELIALVGKINLSGAKNQNKDVLGRVYEYFLGQFANAEGLNGGQFYTPRSIVKLLVEMIEPFHGLVYDPCCGSGGMFVQSENFVKAHNGKLEDISVYGQESNITTWQLCRMNLAIRGIQGNIQFGDSFTNDIHANLKADFIIANPPFNDSDWKGNLLTNDQRWKYGMPPLRNANYAWIQHFIFHLDSKGFAGFVLTNGALSSSSSQEFQIRKNIIQDDLIDCIVTLPNHLFYNTPIPACLWFISKDKSDPRFRKRKGETLFINAKHLGNMTSKKHRELSEYDITQISNTYHQWRNLDEKYEDIDGFCKSSDIKEISNHKYALVPGRYTGSLPLKVPEINSSDFLKVKKILLNRINQLNLGNNFFSEEGGDK